MVDAEQHLPRVDRVVYRVQAIQFILAAIKLGDLRKAERGRTVAEFNQQFSQDVGSRISDVEAGEKRRRTARDLGIRG